MCFAVDYAGSGNASLAALSDDPLSTTLVSGDDFSWTITAQANGEWQVVTGGDFFPLMAFGVQETGTRIGDFTLVLRNNGSDVFSLSELASEQNYVHIGTNTITLATGLVFDEMSLGYALIDGRESPDYAPDPANLQQIGSTPTGLLPIFGAPEANPYYPGIVYTMAPVPEPQTNAMLLLGLAAIGAAVVRRKRAIVR